jgi:uncharacterized RDD family membrane protein YckC
MTDAVYDLSTHEAVPHAPVLYARLPRRIQALSLDALLLAAVLLVASLLAESLPAAVARPVTIAALLMMVLYEPLTVWRYGASLGHRALNLRVVADEGGRLPLWRALLRGIAKPPLGLASLVFVMLTRRHQALHDMVGGCTVQVRDASAATAAHFAPERAHLPVAAGGEAGTVRPHSLRRIAVIAAWELVAYALVALAGAVLVSEVCALHGQCTTGETRLLGVAGITWFGVLLLIMVLGWTGRLPGARGRPGRSDAPAAAPDDEMPAATTVDVPAPHAADGLP